MKNPFAILTIVAALASAPVAPAAPYHKTSAAVGYKCLINHELLIVCGQKTNSPQYIASFVEKLKGTDVDAVMCCPTMWRANLFPSEVDPTWKRYRPDQPPSKFRSYDYIMRYLHAGGDPVKDTLEACRKCGKDFFISYRMNDHHYVTDLEWPSHNAIWREHPEYWLGDSETSPYTRKDNVRLFNYMRPEVRDYYFAILRELCTKYDVDGVELDFQRFPKFFRTDETAEGARVMTAFVRRIREMIDRIGDERGKSLKLCVRVPETLAKCEAAGLDVPGWDAAGLTDMINISSFYNHTMELDIEGFRAKARRARIYGEMNYVTFQHPKDKFARRYTTPEIYRASALNLFHRGADGLSLFNYDYVPEKLRVPMAEVLKRIADVAFLKTQPKDYVISSGFGTFPATNEKTFDVVISDDTTSGQFVRAVLRVETRASCADLRVGVWLNGKALQPCEHDGTELFPPLAQNAAYPAREMLKFFAVPLELLKGGSNRVEVKRLVQGKAACQFRSVEIALYARH
ncbi:MAG TPA: hypothetical protein PLU30_00670 [Verrucomicrobiae bacterium]|nr:hypothetical protein [Verrucomicrobiae bacterium]